MQQFAIGTSFISLHVRDSWQRSSIQQIANNLHFQSIHHRPQNSVNIYLIKRDEGDGIVSREKNVFARNTHHWAFADPSSNWHQTANQIIEIVSV